MRPIDIRNITYYNKGGKEKPEMPMTPREMIKHLKKYGFEIVGQNGSHVKMRNTKTGRQTEVSL